MTSKELKQKADEFLNSRKFSSHLEDIVKLLEENLKKKKNVVPCLLTLEYIFSELLKNQSMIIKSKPVTKSKDDSAEIKYREYLQKQYKNGLSLILNCLNLDKPVESTQGLTTAMKLLSFEGKYQIDSSANYPTFRLKNILIQLLSDEKVNLSLFQRFQEYTNYKDILFHTWRLLPGLVAPKCNSNDIYIENLLHLINSIGSLAVKEEEEDEKTLCIENDVFKYDYNSSKKNLNKVWAFIMVNDQWKHNEATHRQLLIILLEKVLEHLDKPLLLTDFLMESLDVGGPISLLSLQGIFILIQHHNLTYPNVYEKLYSMFEPEIFHTKFKARLFYLADIFLSSSHLPENLVAGFVKRLARLSLIAPPQDILIILNFIGNLIIRHPGLKKLIFHSSEKEVANDPYIMDERNPSESKAIESSLWEIASLQLHSLSPISVAAKLMFANASKNKTENDLSQILELNENDMFDQMIKKSKGFPLNFERPNTMLTAKDDKIKTFWNLY